MPVRGSGPSVFSFWANKDDTVPYNYSITGQTLNSTGGTQAGCNVYIYYTKNNQILNSTVSDVNGNYSFNVNDPYSAPSQFYVVAYLPGSPDVAGTTVNTLTGS